MEHKVKFVKDNDKSLKHYGVLGMKWGVRKDKYYETVGPVSNKYYSVGNKSFFKKGVKDIKISSNSSSLKNSGSRYTFKFDKTTFDKVKAWKKKSSGKSSGSKKSTGTKAKAEAALKEKIASASKKSSSGKSGGSGSSKSSSSKASSNISTTETKEDENLVSVDPDFNEKYFTASNKLGNTRFYAYKNDDGVWVISDKDKKWVLPEGIEPDKNDLAEKLEKFENSLKELIEASGYEYTEDELDMWTTAAINKIISELQTPQEEMNQKVADIINNLLDSEEDKDDSESEDYEDKSNQTKLDNAAKALEELEKKKKK